MRTLVLVIIVVTLSLLAVGCDEGSSKTGAQQICNATEGAVISCALNDEGGPTVVGVPEIEAAGSTPITTGGGTDNPYNCPDGTVIRSDCSVESQRLCRCMLP